MRSILRCAAFCFMACASFAQASNEDVRIADEGKIGAWWQLADGVRIGAPGYPEQALAGRHDACIALGYLIQPDGTTSDHVVVKRWTDASSTDEMLWDQFGKAASRELYGWKFAPRPGSGMARPTFTVATFVFSARGSQAGDLREHCSVEDLGDAVEVARHAAFENRSLNRGWLDNAYREALRLQMRDNQARQCRMSHSMNPECVN